MSRIMDYRKKCCVMKQIQSNRALKYQKINKVMNIFTILVSGTITFIGFSGTKTISTFLKDAFGMNLLENTIQTGFNFMVFLLFILTIVHMVFGFNEKQSTAEKAIHSFSELINEIDDRIEAGEIEPAKDIANKYEMLVQNSPNTDKEYLNAKKKLVDKENQKSIISKNSIGFAPQREQQKYLINLLENSEMIQNYLNTIHAVEGYNDELYLGGGVIRNLVWDNLNDYKVPTSNKDVDVIYFNKDKADKSSDLELEKELTAMMPNVTWSVKNQARMHKCNDDEAYDSIEEAVSKWPEVASAILVRKDKNGEYKFVAPFGYDDLLRMILRPTPHFSKRMEAYRKRIDDHGWHNMWGKLLVIGYEKQEEIDKS